MKHKQSDMKQEEIRWRRDKILELSSRGNSEREIAATLQISPATAHRDIAYLNQLAKENISKYIDEKLTCRVPEMSGRDYCHYEGIMEDWSIGRIRRWC